MKKWSFDRFCDDNSFLFKVKDSKTILSYNKKLKETLDLKWRYKYVDITCSHFGEHKSCSEGNRPNQKVYANECPFRVRVVFKPAAEKFIVMKCETRHGPLPPKVPHPISAEHYALYCRNAYVMVNYIINRMNRSTICMSNSKLKGAARLLALSSLSVGANPTYDR